MSHLFYALEAGQPLPCKSRLGPDYTVETWRPSRDGLPPARLGRWPFGAWWAFDRLGIFSNRNSGVLSISRGGRIVHRSLVTARYFRFPAMGADDLQIGDTWTDPGERGKGLAKVAICEIHKAWEGQFRRMWYLTDSSNTASIRVIESCGYRLEGSGERTRRLGLRLLGRFELSHPTEGLPASNRDS